MEDLSLELRVVIVVDRRTTKAEKHWYIYEAHELVDCYELPTYLAEQVQNCNAQMNIDVA